MKRLSKVLLSTIISILVVGTFFIAVKAAGETGDYSGSGTGFGGNVTVTITVEKNADGETVLNSVKSIEGPDETPQIGGAALSELKNQIEGYIGEPVTNTYVIDGVSGASVTSQGVRDALALAQTAAEAFDPEPSPTPTPIPSPKADPKDESCEKVIGPTWHWNNEKGVCEEYSTIGTSTR